MFKRAMSRCPFPTTSLPYGGVVYYMWMLPSKVMPYHFRLAAPLMDSSIVHWNSLQFLLPRLAMDNLYYLTVMLSKNSEK
jgi:hypothetical protein